MPDIDPSFLHLSQFIVNPALGLLSQQKRKLGAEQCQAVYEETIELLDASFIKEIQYPTLISNVVLVWKANGKWRRCIDFIDLNTACSKDPYPPPSINGLIDDALGYKILRFMVAS